MNRPSDSDAVDILRRLVEIASVSGQETDAVSFLVQTMQRLGFKAHIDAAGNAVGVREGPGPSGAFTDVILLGHIDTVPGDIPVRLEDGRLYGRGSVDAKGPLAAFAIAAARASLQTGRRLTIVGAVEEEAATSKGARYIAGQFRPDYCIIGEPSGWDAVTLGYKGRLLLDYELEQPMRHAAGPGESVAEQAVTWWQHIAAYAREYNQTRDRLFQQLLPSLRHIHTESDGLTDRAVARVGLRLPPDFDVAPLREFVYRYVGDAAVSVHGYEPAFRSTRRTPLVRAFNVALREAGVRPRYKLKTGTSDMNVVGPRWQCPILAYGPGDSALDHTPEEYLVVEEYLRAVVVLEEVLALL